jgi:hypothetical protein
MTAPQNLVTNPLPQDGEQPLTYSQLLDKLNCVCSAGAQIRPSSLPSATIDMGDIIADHSRYISIFTSAYGVVTVVLQVIACIIDVLCCLLNPFCVIFAMIRLFGTCIPNFILIFPQFAIPAIIICVLKILLAIVTYITTVIAPIIQVIIQNIQDLVAAIDDKNDDAIAAIAFKVAALIKELYNIVGILSVLGGLWVMLKALIDAGISIPCGGSGGSCDVCGSSEEICPSTLQQTDFSNTDGVLSVYYDYDGFNFQIFFSSLSNRSDFLQMRNFFPRGLNYSAVTDLDDVPYVLNTGGNDYIVTGIDSDGTASLTQMQNTYSFDGYLSDRTPSGYSLGDPLKARLSTNTKTFDFTLSGRSRYITLQDTRGQSQSIQNGGTWKIQYIYDSYNVLLERSADTWSYGAPYDHLRWKLELAAPSSGSNLNYTLNINHTELIRHGLIGVGCHPSVSATREALDRRFPDMLTVSLPNLLLNLPDLDSLILSVNSCISAVGPEDVDSQYVLDNYETIAIEAAGLETCIVSELTSFQLEVEEYAEDVYPIIFDPETSADGYSEADGYFFDVDPKIQVVGYNSVVKLIPFDRNGGKLGVTVPPGIVEVEFINDVGVLSSVTEELDSEGNPTGKFTANITSYSPAIVTITAKVGNRDVADFNGSDLIPREVQVEFVDAEDSRRKSTTISGEVSIEPIGIVRSAT